MAEIFVAVLGASNYTYAEVTWSQMLPDWIGSHVRLFRHIGGVTRLLVPDNLKRGVNKASFYDPEINRGYGRMAEHYAVGVLPARLKKPKDKASVEAGVRFAPGYIIGRLRNQTFFSPAEANARHHRRHDGYEHAADAQARRQSRRSAGEPRATSVEAIAGSRI